MSGRGSLRPRAARAPVCALGEGGVPPQGAPCVPGEDGAAAGGRAGAGLACAAAGVLGARWSRGPVSRLFWWFPWDPVPRAGPAPSRAASPVGRPPRPLLAESLPRARCSSGSPRAPSRRRPPPGGRPCHTATCFMSGSLRTLRFTWVVSIDVLSQQGQSWHTRAASSRRTPSGPGGGHLPMLPVGPGDGGRCARACGSAVRPPRLLAPSGCVAPQGGLQGTARRGTGWDPGKGLRVRHHGSSLLAKAEGGERRAPRGERAVGSRRSHPAPRSQPAQQRPGCWPCHAHATAVRGEASQGFG